MTVFGIDARAAAEEPAGRGRYVRELLVALAALDGDERYVLWCREPWRDLGERFSYRVVGAPDPLWHAVAALRASRSCDAFLSTNSYLTTWGLRAPCAAVVHDMIAFVEPAWAQARAARIERATLGFAVRRAAALVCVSEATRRDLVARYPRADAKAVVIPEAAPSDLRPGDEPAPARPFVLAVGTLEPRKNLERLMDAWASLSDDVRGEHELVLVGPRGWEAEAIEARAAQRPGDVRLAGFVADAELTALYRSCAAFAYPSLYEGFGLPVLEAMACGAPVLTSNVSSLPEVAGDAALLVDPRDTAAIARGLERLLTNDALRADLARRGPERASAYSWRRAAEETRELLRTLSRP